MSRFQLRILSCITCYGLLFSGCSDPFRIPEQSFTPPVSQTQQYAKQKACSLTDRSQVLNLFAVLQEEAMARASGITGDQSVISFLLGPYDTPSFISGAGFQLEPNIIPSSAEQAAKDIANKLSVLWALGQDDTLIISSIRAIPAAGQTVIVFSQHHRGVTVEGAELKMILDKNYRVIFLTNTTVPDISSQEIPSLSEMATKGTLKGKQGTISITHSTLVYYPTEDRCDPAKLAWRNDYWKGNDKRTAWVDAHGGEVLADYSHMKNSFINAPPRTLLFECQYPYSCSEYLAYPIKTVSDQSCTYAGLTGDALNVCLWMEDTWNYWRDPFHTPYQRDSYNA